MNEPKTTYVDDIMDAAAQLHVHHRHSGGTFTAADLVIRAWKIDPYRFGLAGYERCYPDSNKVLCKLTALERKGWLERVAPRVYRVTAGGLWMSERARGRGQPAP